MVILQGIYLQAALSLQVAVLVLDAIDCTVDGRFLVTQQDFRLAELIGAEGRASVIVVNKWDAVPHKDTHTLATYQKEILAQLRPLDWATVVFTSALSGAHFLLPLETQEQKTCRVTKREELDKFAWAACKFRGKCLYETCKGCLQSSHEVSFIKASPVNYVDRRRSCCKACGLV